MGVLIVNMQPLTITAKWDTEACVWIATSHDVDGLAIEASTMDALVKRLKIIIPELMTLNHNELFGTELHESTQKPEWYFALGLMKASIRNKIGTAPLDVNWQHWLSVQTWTKRQAALLICGIDPNKFKDELPEPVLGAMQELCAFNDEASFPPEKWIREFDTLGFASCLPRPMIWIAGFDEGQDQSDDFKTYSEAINSNRHEPTELAESKTGEKELTTWLRETWINEGMPEGSDFFKALKKYVKQPKSPIIDHWTTSAKGAGFKWITTNASGDRTKKAILNRVTDFKKELLENTVNSQN